MWRTLQPLRKTQPKRDQQVMAACHSAQRQGSAAPYAPLCGQEEATLMAAEATYPVETIAELLDLTPRRVYQLTVEARRRRMTKPLSSASC